MFLQPPIPSSSYSSFNNNNNNTIYIFLLLFSLFIFSIQAKSPTGGYAPGFIECPPSSVGGHGGNSNSQIVRPADVSIFVKKNKQEKEPKKIKII